MRVSRQVRIALKLRPLSAAIGGMKYALLSLLITSTSLAGSATWNLNPINGDWDTAENWTPNTVPNSPSDVATFDVSNITAVTFTRFDLVTANVVFNPGASAFTITAPVDGDLDFGNTGITNNSGLTQTFAAGPAANGTSHFTFEGNATAGNMTSFTAYGDTSPIVSNSITFLGGDAGTATLHATGGVSGGQGGEIIFFDGFLGGGTANAATVIVDGAVGNNFMAGALARFDTQATPPTTAGNATFMINGAPNAGGSSGSLQFGSFPNSNPTAGNATLIANGGIGGGPGGVITFNKSSTGGTARLQLFGNGKLDLSKHDAPGVTIGSLDGQGSVFLGTNTLTIGSDNQSTTFSGVIKNSGSLIKTGTGTLTLTGANTYTGGTTINAGTLKTGNTVGSATGTGPVSVNSGILGGQGVIAGPVAIGSGTGPGAILAPGAASSGPRRLTFQSSLTIKADGDYACQLNTKRGRADAVVANGVVLENGAQFAFGLVGNKPLSLGTVFTILSNTSPNPISGTFSNLTDGSILTDGKNRYLVSYSGGDGNDLTLTVVE